MSDIMTLELPVFGFEAMTSVRPENPIDVASATEVPAESAARDLDQRGRARQPSRGGRPSLYTAPTVLAVVAALFGGASRAEAARRAGVGVSTFYVWLQLGRAGHPTYAPLADAVKNAEIASRTQSTLAWLIRTRGFWKRIR